MHDYPGESERIEKRIRKLQNRLHTSTNEFNRKSLVEELGRLEQERLHSENLFESQARAEEVTAEDAEEFPILAGLRTRYPDLQHEYRHFAREVQSLQLYLHHFDTEYIGLLNERKLRLDVKFSLERDNFYNAFSTLRRRADSYCTEASRINKGEYTKAYEEEILRRMVEMRHNLFIETNRFFLHVQRFAEDLLEDMNGDAILCQNADEQLSYSNLDRERELRGKTVQQGIEQIYEFSSEVISYLNIPDFG
jgi:hypothetical protein